MAVRERAVRMIEQAVRPKMANDITELVGNTPLVRLNRIAEGLNGVVVAKLESFNPMSSVKDRIGLAMIEAMVSGLQRGESFLIYPSGHVKWQPEEVLGSARAAAEILERCPQAQVVLVRTSGLWGSSFSYAQAGNPPHLTRCVLRGFAWLLASGALTGLIGAGISFPSLSKTITTGQKVG